MKAAYFGLLLTLSLSSCSRSQSQASEGKRVVVSAASAGPMNLEVKRVDVTSESSPMPTADPMPRHEITLDTVVWNHGSQAMRFDLLGASFYSGENLICGTSYILTGDDKIRAQYSLNRGDGPLMAFLSDDHGTFVVSPGEGSRFILKSANCNFGDESRRKVAVELLRSGNADEPVSSFTVTIPDSVKQ
jgi:hypothetical protein